VLDQPVASLLPAAVSVPELDGRAITLLDLATHTSGLPRLPTNFWPEEPTEEQLLDPYANYQVEDLYEFLSSYALPVVPGERFEYSNLGGGLLGHALSFAAGTSYEEAIACRISEPLGLKDTTLHPSTRQERRLATGHDPDLQPVPSWTLTPAFEGAGALRSTAEDIGRYIAAELAASAPAAAHWPVLESMALTQIPRRSTDQGDPIGLAWFFDGPDTFWHNGGTGGYSSFALVDRARGVGVAVLANTSTVLTDALGEQLHQLLAGNTPPPLELPVFVHLDAAALEPCVGTYRLLDNGLELTILREGDRLYLEYPGARSRLYPTSPTTFYSKIEEVTFRFEPEGADPYPTLVVEYSADESYAATRL
jgi:D-alanyl-D-alanine-carboxypeptidase/D-alanyl-D-alanine-endopeptidase